MPFSHRAYRGYSNEKIRKDPCAGDCWGEPDWLQLKRTQNIVLQDSAGGSFVETKNLSTDGVLFIVVLLMQNIEFEIMHCISKLLIRRLACAIRSQIIVSQLQYLLAPISIHVMPRPRCNDIELCDVWQLAQIRGAFTDLSPTCSANQCDWDSFALSGAETSEMYIFCILSEKDGNSLDQSQWLYR